MATIFLKLIYFRQNIWCSFFISFTSNFYLGTSWKQPYAAVKLPMNLLQFMGKSRNAHGISVKIFETWSEKQLSMANICLFQITFSQWRPAQIIFAFSKTSSAKGLIKILRFTDQPFTFFANFFCNFLSHFINKHWPHSIFVFFNFYNFWLLP